MVQTVLPFSLQQQVLMSSRAIRFPQKLSCQPSSGPSGSGRADGPLVVLPPAQVASTKHETAVKPAPPAVGPAPPVLPPDISVAPGGPQPGPVLPPEMEEEAPCGPVLPGEGP